MKFSKTKVILSYFVGTLDLHGRSSTVSFPQIVIAKDVTTVTIEGGMADGDRA